jgi:bis(5'-adenosyl)-triphosphatase
MTSNIKPIVPGHVLIISKRVCPKFSQLSHDEAMDLMSCVHKIVPVLEKYYDCEASNIGIQDGEAAGQSVPHVHVHILPRKLGDFKRIDDVYGELANQHLNKVLRVEENRRQRSLEEMAAQASELSKLFE